jgi:Bacteriophage head to tail connecting protein
MAVSTNATKDVDDLWLRTYFLNRLALLDRDRASYWPTWRDQASMFAPKRGKFLTTANDYTRGKRKDARIIDNTSLQAARIMSSGMMAGISSPARPWFKLRLANTGSNDAPGVRDFLDEVQRRILYVFQESNLYNCLHTLYGELGTFGTGVLWVDEDEQDIVRGYTLTVGEYWLASSQRSAVDTLYRSVWWTVRQIVAKFGRDAVSAGVRANYDNGQLDLEYELIHAIEPNPNAFPRDAQIPANGIVPWDGRLSQHFPFRSVWFERGTQGEHTLLRVSGYEELPAMCPRWEIAGTETYGSGYAPGWIALGDAQQLQQQQKEKLQAIQKMHKPPMRGPASLKNEPASLLPGGITYTNDPNAKFEAAIDVRLDISHLTADIRETQERIKQAYYADLWLMMTESDRREITAREIDERHEEKMLMLGPVLERLHDELLDPLVKRVFNIMARNGLFSDLDMPQGMSLGGMQVEFISTLAQAQKAVDTTSIERLWAFSGQIAQLGRPDAMDKLDVDETMDAYADRLGTPSKILISTDKAQQIRQQRAQQQAQQQALQNLEQAATTAKTASQIDVGGGRNAVQAMVGG